VLYGEAECRMLKYEENQHEGHRDSGSQSEVEMGRPCGKNGLAQMGTRYGSVGRKNRQKNWATEDRWRDTFKREEGQLSRASKNWS
jgi:hypothetical protein